MTKEDAIEYLEKLYMIADFTDEYGDMDDTEPYETALNMAIEALKEQKTGKCMTCIMTYIEIVRCRDCRHLSHRNGGHCDVWDWHISNDAFYCGCGERKADETD